MCPYLGPVTCDHALPIEVLSLRLLASHADFLRRSSRNHSSVTNPQRTSALEAICLSFSAKKHKTSNCWSQVYRAVHYKLEKTTNIFRHAISGWRCKVFSLATTSAACQQAVPFRVAGEASCVRTRECRKRQGLWPPSPPPPPLPRSRFLSCAARPSGYSDDIYPPTEDLVAGNNISCNTLFL